jgi:hypothetical protein
MTDPSPQFEKVQTSSYFGEVFDVVSKACRGRVLPRAIDIPWPATEQEYRDLLDFLEALPRYFTRRPIAKMTVRISFEGASDEPLPEEVPPDHPDPLLDAANTLGETLIALRDAPYESALGWAGRDEERLRLVCVARGYERGWVWHRLRALGEQV